VLREFFTEYVKLSYRYSVEAARELANLEKIVTGLFDKAGLVEVLRRRIYPLVREEVTARHPNPVQANRHLA
jgi:hypothetical protein